MKFNVINFLMLLILLLSVNLSSSINKIQVNEEWTYTSNGENYNEIALENFVLGDSAYTKIETNRPFPFEYYQFTKEFSNLFNGLLKINIQLDEGFMYLTQGGGLPVWHDYKLKGNVSFTTADYSYYQDFSPTSVNDTTMEWIIDGVIEQGLQITTPTRYNIRQTYRWADNVEIMYDYHYLMTSFENNNFTIQYEDFTISFQVESPDQSDQFIISYNPINSETRLYIRDNTVQVKDIEGQEESNDTLQSVNPFVYKISLDDAYQVPIIIEQTEPITVIDGLSLNQESNAVTYLLADAFQTRSTSLSTTIPFSYYFISIVIIAFINGTRRKLK